MRALSADSLKAGTSLPRKQIRQVARFGKLVPAPSLGKLCQAAMSARAISADVSTLTISTEDSKPPTLPASNTHTPSNTNDNPEAPPANFVMDFTNWMEPWHWGLKMRNPASVFPTVAVPADPSHIRPLPEDLQPALASVHYTTPSGEAVTLADLQQRSDPDACLILHKGKVVHSYVRDGYSATSDHWMFSVSRTFIALVAGKLVEQGVLDMGAPIETIIPELASSGYRGATLRQLLDMRSGCSPPAQNLLPLLGLWPTEPGSAPPQDLHSYIVSTQGDQPHGGSFTYRRGDSLVIAWLCERASGKRLPALISEFIWQHMGAEQPAQYIIGLDGQALYDTGLCTNLRDLARFGQLMLEDGRPGAAQVLPKGWMADTRTGDDDVRAAFPGNFFGHPLPNGMYRNHMWVPDIQRGATMLFGAHGQIVYADPSCDLVGVLLSFQPNPLDAINLEWVRAFNAVGDHLNASATAPKVPQQ